MLPRPLCAPARIAALALCFAPAPALSAQQWNTPAALELVGRGVARRLAAQADSSLASYRTRAHGFVLFLAQVGAEGLNEAPHLVKGDELDVEVYWKAPNRSKQVILGWRDGSFLPNETSYHRDHLGIVTNNFGNVIRIGEGDEVRDAVHPLSPAGLTLYDYAIQDSLSIRNGSRQVTVRAVAVRPKSFSRPLVVGTLYLDATTGELVRFRFSFTPAAYIDRDLEDISITLENGLYEQRYWLPYRQEVEIRRRVSWLDLPARGIIRGRWEIGDYDLNANFPDATFAGPAIDGLRRPVNGDSAWKGSLLAAIDSIARPVERQDMAALRLEVERIAGAHALSGLPSKRLATNSVSDLVHVNRVQGLAFGGGATFGVSRRRAEIRPSIGIGTSDWRVTGGLTARLGTGRTQLALGAGRTIADFSDIAVVSPVINSLGAQEFGDDYGDYVLVDRVRAEVRTRLDPRTTLALEPAIERTRSLDVAATPATGSFRPNPPLGAGTYHIGRIRLERSGAGFAARTSLGGSLSLEAGDRAGLGPGYLRAVLQSELGVSIGATRLRAQLYAGAGTDSLPAYRSFVLGGRGTLPGEPYRAYGGSRMALGRLEWRFDVPAPAIPLGSYASTGHTLTLAPFLAAGWASRPPPGMPWDRTGGIRPVAGLAAEFFMRIVRVEAGVALRGGGFGISVDVNRDWWGIL
jgi:hypothetical protein